MTINAIEMIRVEIPKSIIERIQMIIDTGTTGYTSLTEYLNEALLQDIESTLDCMGNLDFPLSCTEAP